MTDELTYEKALEKLDEKLKLLEDGDLSLEDALKAVDEARVYLKVCTDRLEVAPDLLTERIAPGRDVVELFEHR